LRDGKKLGKVWSCHGKVRGITAGLRRVLEHIMTMLNSKYDEIPYDLVKIEKGHKRALFPPKLIRVGNVLP
jgi:hypothetical protein